MNLGLLLIFLGIVLAVTVSMTLGVLLIVGGFALLIF